MPTKRKEFCSRGILFLRRKSSLLFLLCKNMPSCLFEACLNTTFVVLVLVCIKFFRKRSVAQLVRVSVSKTDGCKFESCRFCNNIPLNTKCLTAEAYFFFALGFRLRGKQKVACYFCIAQICLSPGFRLRADVVLALAR